MNIYKFIPSKTTAKYAEESGHVFSDWDIATILYHLEMPLNDRHEYIKQLAEETTDGLLVKQIKERIAYDEKSLKLFERNSTASTNYIYALETKQDDEWDDNGYFAEVDLAKKYGVKSENLFSIGKYSIINKHNEQELCNFDYAVAGVAYDKDGRIRHYWTTETEEEEAEQVSCFAEDRFESRFVIVPNYFDKGDIVRYMEDRETGVVITSQSEWKQFLESIEKRNLHVDWSDASIMVEYESENGHSYHEHINPIFLEKV